MNLSKMFLFGLFFLTFAQIHSQDYDLSANFAGLLAEPPSPGRQFIMDATLETYKVTDKEPDTYTVEVTLVQGTWVGLSSIELYRSVVIFQGPQYQTLFPVNRPRGFSPKVLPINSKVLAHLTYRNTYQPPQGKKMLVFTGQSIRKLE